MIDLGKTNLLSSLLDSAGSENSEDGIRGLLHATTSHSGAQLSAKDVVDRIIAQTGDDVASAHSLADDPVVFEKLEEQV